MIFPFYYRQARESVLIKNLLRAVPVATFHLRLTPSPHSVSEQSESGHCPKLTNSSFEVTLRYKLTNVLHFFQAHFSLQCGSPSAFH